MAQEISQEEAAFHAAVDANSEFEAEVFRQVSQFSDDQWYTLQEVHARHLCGFATIKVYRERCGIEYQCANCGVAGIIGN